MISPALAHGSSGAGASAGFGPLVLVAVGIVGVLLAEKKWRDRKRQHADSGQ